MLGDPRSLAEGLTVMIGIYVIAGRSMVRTSLSVHMPEVYLDVCRIFMRLSHCPFAIDRFGRKGLATQTIDKMFLVMVCLGSAIWSDASGTGYVVKAKR